MNVELYANLTGPGRDGFIGYSDATPLLGVAVMACVNTALWILCRQMLKSGYKLKA
jgi:ABC-2 type transport system permease protein